MHGTPLVSVAEAIGEIVRLLRWRLEVAVQIRKVAIRRRFAVILRLHVLSSRTNGLRRILEMMQIDLFLGRDHGRWCIM
jgi:hypothetical protein